MDDVVVPAEVNENAGPDDVPNVKGELPKEGADDPNENPVDVGVVEPKVEPKMDELGS